MSPDLRVYIGCFGSGLGHASRMLEVAEKLTERGAAVQLSSSGEVAELIRRRGFDCNSLPLADVKYSDSGEFALKETLVSSPSILARTYLQLAKEVANIGRFSPDVVLSDSALSTVLAAKAHRLPTFTVLNQLNLSSHHGTANAPSRLLSTGTSAAMGKLWEFSDEILLPDLPPPLTISEKNLWGSNVEKTRYIGFLASFGRRDPDEVGREFVRDPRPKVFWQVSGPPKTRNIFLRQALETAEFLSEEFAFVITAGSPGASEGPSRVPGGWVYGWCDIADFYFDACDIVVSRAGHGTIGQSLTASKPSVLVPIPRQPEQEGNAEKAVGLGVSIKLDQEELTPERFRGVVALLLKDGYSERARKLGEVARSYDARSEVVRVVESAALAAHRAPR